jgi:MarR family transcriptional regulator, lower aerobic nicotinate degradation pathway regulator
MAKQDTPEDYEDASGEWRRAALSDRPGFLIRRLHQIHTALFNEECGNEKITPIMYSVLSALEQRGAIDQTTLAREVAVDKTNMADVLERMRKRGLIRRRMSPKDRRVRLTVLTDDGRALLDRVNRHAERAHRRTVEDLTPDEQHVLMHLMARIIEAKEGPESV